MSLAKVLIGVGVIGLIELEYPGTLEVISRGIVKALKDRPPVDAPQMLPDMGNPVSGIPTTTTMRVCQGCGACNLGTCSSCNAERYAGMPPNVIAVRERWRKKGMLGAKKASGRAIKNGRGNWSGGAKKHAPVEHQATEAAPARAFRNIKRGGVLGALQPRSSSEPLQSLGDTKSVPEPRGKEKSAEVGRRGRREGYKFSLSLHRLELYDAGLDKGLSDKAARKYVIETRIKESKEKPCKFPKNLVSKHSWDVEKLAVDRIIRAHRSNGRDEVK